jgi:hypothetical protein
LEKGAVALRKTSRRWSLTKESYSTILKNV